MNNYNKLIAIKGARIAGVTPEHVANLEKVLGYAQTMEMFRRIGVIVDRAEVHLARRINDRIWGKRLIDGDAVTKREFNDLTFIISKRQS